MDIMEIQEPGSLPTSDRTVRQWPYRGGGVWTKSVHEWTGESIRSETAPRCN